MQTVSAAYKEQMRKKWRNPSYVRVSYGVFNLTAGQQATFADNGHTDYANLNLNDDILPDRDYATFERDYWRADGKQLILPAAGPYNYDGFVSSAVSGDNNTFSSNPTITVSFTDPQDIFGLTFTFPEGQVPQEIKVNGTTYNPDSELYVMPDRLQDVTSIAIEFVKAPSPGRRVRLNRLQFGQTVMFQNRQIIKTSFESSIDFLSLSLTQKKLAVTIDNREQVYNPLNPSGLYGYLEAKQPMEIDYGYELDNGTVEWIVGDNLVLESTPIAADTQASFSAVDSLTNLTGMFYHGLYRPHGISLYDLAKEVLDDAGVEHYVIDDHLKDVYTKAALPVVTHRECLQIIANAGQCILYTDRRGYIKLEIALDPTIQVGDNGHMIYSSSDSAYNDMDLPTTKYADFLPDSWKAAGKKILLPTSGPYIRTGFVSDSICGKDGSMTDMQSGSRIEFKHAINSEAQSLTVAGKTLQTVTEQGKNLLANGNIYYTTPMPSPDAVPANGPTLGLVPHNYALAGKQVTISVDVKVTNGIARTSGPSRIGCEISFQRSDNSFFYIGVWKSVANGANFDTRISSTNTLPSDITGAIGENNFYIQCLGDVTSVGHAQLEFGSTATAYAPFVPDSPSPDYPAPISGTTSLTISDSGSNSQTVTLPHTLYSLPDGTADDYDAVSGQGTQRVRKVVFDGDEDITVDTIKAATQVFAIVTNETFPSNEVFICSSFSSDRPAGDVEKIIPLDTHWYVAINKSRLSGWSDDWKNGQKIAAFRAWLASHPVTVLYQLATPQEISGETQTIPTYYPYTQITNDAGAEMTATAPIKKPLFYWTYSFPYSSYQIPITFDNVDGEYAADFDVVYKLDGAEIDRVSVTGNTAVKYTVEHFVEKTDRIEIEIHKWCRGTRRAMIAQIGDGRVNDMNIDFNTATEKPIVEKSSQVKTVTVNCYGYTPAAAATELYHENITPSGPITLNISHEAASEISATVTGVKGDDDTVSETDAVITAQTHYTYYSTVTLTGTQPCTLTLTGKVLTPASVGVVKQINPQGEDKPALQNPLITDLTNAQNTAVWIADYFSKRNFLTATYRGNPEIDAHDLIYMESQFEKLFPARVMNHKIEFNGALSGSIKAVKMNG